MSVEQVYLGHMDGATESVGSSELSELERRLLERRAAQISEQESRIHELALLYGDKTDVDDTKSVFEYHNVGADGEPVSVFVVAHPITGEMYNYSLTRGEEVVADWNSVTEKFAATARSVASERAVPYAVLDGTLDGMKTIIQELSLVRTEASSQVPEQIDRAA